MRGGDRSEIAAAVSAARGADAAVVVIGGSSARDFDTEFLQTGAAKAAHDEVRDMECGEGFDRATLALLGEQEELLRRIKATGTPLIVVCIAGRPLDLSRASEQADALLMAWYPGARGGDAVAETKDFPMLQGNATCDENNLLVHSATVALIKDNVPVMYTTVSAE